MAAFISTYAPQLAAIKEPNYRAMMPRLNQEQRKTLDVALKVIQETTTADDTKYLQATKTFCTTLDRVIVKLNKNKEESCFVKFCNFCNHAFSCMSSYVKSAELIHGMDEYHAALLSRPKETTKESHLKQLQTQLDQNGSELSRLKGEYRGLSDLKKDLSSLLKTLLLASPKRYSSLLEEKETLKKQNKTHESTLERCNEEIEKLNKELTVYKKQNPTITHYSIKDKIEELRRSIESYELTIKLESSSLDYCNEQIQSLEKEITDLDKKIKQHQTNVATLQQKMEGEYQWMEISQDKSIQTLYRAVQQKLQNDLTKAEKQAQYDFSVNSALVSAEDSSGHARYLETTSSYNDEEYKPHYSYEATRGMVQNKKITESFESSWKLDTIESTLLKINKELTELHAKTTMITLKHAEIRKPSQELI